LQGQFSSGVLISTVTRLFPNTAAAYVIFQSAIVNEVVDNPWTFQLNIGGTWTDANGWEKQDDFTLIGQWDDEIPEGNPWRILTDNGAILWTGGVPALPQSGVVNVD